MEQNRNQRNQQHYQSGNMSRMNQQSNAGMQHRKDVVNNNSQNGNNNPQNGNDWSNYRERSLSSNSEHQQQNK